MKTNILSFFFVIIFSSIVINVNAQCPPSITSSSALPSIQDPTGTWTICPGNSVLIVSSSASGYLWYHDDILIDTATLIAISPKDVGEYYVIVDGCATPSDIITIAWFDLPVANITFSDSPVCSGTTVTATLEGDLGVDWFWREPEQSDINPIVGDYFSNTLFSAVVTSADLCPTVIPNMLIVRQPLDPGEISETQDICSGDTPSLLTGTTPTGEDGTYLYQWEQSTVGESGPWSNATPGTSTNETYQPPTLTQTTWYRRVVTTPDPYCPLVTQFDPIEITVNEIPAITSATTLDICSTGSLNYTITSDVDGTTFTWTGVNTSGNVTGVTASGSGNTIDDQLSIPVGATSGTATYTITPTGPAPTYCVGPEVDLVVTVLPLPIPTIDGDVNVCIGSTGNLYETEAGMTNYEWTILGGTITSGQGTYEIAVTWTTTEGSQWVRVTYTGLNGCPPLQPIQYDVTVNELPIPDLNGPPTPCLGASGNVYTTDSGMTGYDWEVSSGGTITGGGDNFDNITITWNTPGVQWVSIVYTDANGCTNTEPVVYTVNVSEPSIDGSTTTCLGSDENVYTTESGMTDYVWNYPGGTLITGGTPFSNTVTLQWNSTGTKTVSVNYTTAAGCTAADPATISVDVEPLPTPSFLSGDNDVCEGTTGVVYTTESGMEPYSWSVSAGGTITSAGEFSNSATVTWDAAGDQYVYVNYTDANGCSAENPTPYPVTVNDLPEPTITGSDTECNGTTGVDYITESGQSSYDWAVTGGTITSGELTNEITVTWSSSGPQTVSVNYTDGNGCEATSPTEFPVDVLPLPVPDIDGLSSVCVDATNVEYTTDDDTGITGYQWIVPTGGTIVGSSTNDDLFVTWNTVGTHTVQVTYTGANGCNAAAPSTYDVTVNDLPSPTITNGPNEVCNNSTDQYTTQPGMSNYIWSVTGGTITSGGTSTDNTATITWNTTGTQNVSINYSQTGCPATSAYVYDVTVNPLPTSNAGFDQEIPHGTYTTLEGVASGGTSGYTQAWTPIASINGDNTTLLVQTTNLYSDTDFTFTVTDSKGCIDTDIVQVTLIGPQLEVDATASPQVICNIGTTVTLNATATGGNSAVQADYTWTSTPSGFASTEQNPEVNPTQTTTYNISVWDGYNTAPNTILVTVNPLPTIFTVTGGGEYCAGGTGVSVGLNGSQSGVNYQLVLDGSDIGIPIPGTGSSISFVDNTGAGSYTIRAINGTTSCEQDMTGSVTITINPLPTSEAGSAQLIPYGTNTTLVGVAGAGTPSYNYAWTPIGSINGTSTSLTALTTNLYTDTDFTFAVTDSKGCTANDIVSITLDGSALAVTATAVEDVICNNGETVQLNATATGGNSATQADYSWTSTPSGFTSTEQSPQVNPTQTTNYYISVNDGYNTATNSVTVTVNPLPTLFTVTGGGEYCSGGTGVSVGLNGSQVGVDYQLLFDGANSGSPVSGNGAAISFGDQTSAGLYTVHAINATTTCERNMTGSVSISVNPLPTALAGIDQTINYGISTSLSGSASSGTSPWNYLWTPDNMIYSGSGTSNPVTENLYVTTDFLLTVTDSKGCTDTDQMQVIVDGDPLSVAASVDNSIICSGSDAQLSAAGSGGNLLYTYLWSCNPGSWTSTEQNPVVNPNITTDYTVTIDDGYNTATSSVSVTVNPLATVYNVTGGGSYCSGDAGVDVGLSNSETGASYQLYLDGTLVGTTVSGTGSSISFGDQTAAGSYTVMATMVVTGCENDMSAAADVIIFPLPNTFEMTGGGSYPEGGIGVPVALTNSQIGIDYQLLLNGSDIGTPVAGTGSPLDFGYQTLAGDYTAVATDAVTGCTIEMLSTVTVIIDPYPSIFHVYGGETICYGSSTEVGLDGSEIGVAYTLSRDGTSVLVGVPGTGDSIHFGAFSTQGIYTVRAENTTTGLTMDMDGNAEIIVVPLPIPYSLTLVQPGDNCVPIIPHLGGSEIGAIYELNYEDFNGYYTPAIETISGTGDPINFSSQTNAGTYTASAYIDYAGISCSIDMFGSLTADSIPKEFQITPQGQLCENDQDLCLVGSEAGIEYQLWLNSQPVGSIVPGDGGPICFGTLSDPGTYRIHAINTATLCEIFFTEEVVVNPQPTQLVMSPVTDCAGSDIKLDGDCEDGIDYYLYLEPATKEFIEVQGPLTCSGGGQINFGPQFDEGVYRIKAVNPVTNCWAWMYGTTTIYPNPEVFEISPQEGGCAPLEIYLENFEEDATYYLYLNGGDNPIQTIEGSTGQVNFGEQYLEGTYTVRAKLTHPGPHYCWSDMLGEVNIYNTATSFDLTPVGPSCPPVTFLLNGSDTGTDYTLWCDNYGEVQTITGDGNNLIFDERIESGQYWVIASTGDGCETQMDGIGVIHELPTLYSITPLGELCSDDNVEIGLTGSDIGVTYYLLRDNAGIIPPAIIIGDGSAIVFGNFSTDGTYTVKAIDDITSCERQMNNELILNDPPNTYSIVPASGLYCPTQTIGLDFSQTGVDYTLHTPDGNDVTVAGTDAAIEFGTSFSYLGDYWVTAFNSATGCDADMDGIVTIYNGPDFFDLTCLTEPLYCSGDNSAIDLVLSYSQTGVIYKLYRDDDLHPVFIEQSGTGSLLSWTAVSQFGAGDYYVKATFIADPTCSALMNGVITVEEIELPTASLSGTETICYSYCTDMEFTLTGTLPFEVIYTANNIIQDPLYFIPGNNPFELEVCPLVNTTYEIVSIQYTEFPYCVGTDISGTFEVVVEPLPVIVNMGSPAATCITEPYTTDVIVENTTAYSWVILGTPNGSISSTNTLNTTYTPGAGDEGTTVQLELTVWGEGSCVDETTTSILDIDIEPIPVITQLDGGTICETGSFTTNVSVDFASLYLWEVISGNGSVSPDDEMNTIYTAATGDGGTTVVLQITATGSGTCSGEEVTGLIEIIVEPLPTADAGTGGAICESETFQLNGSATNYDPTTVLWEVIDGVGSFDDITNLNAVFTPGEINVTTSMTLRLTVSGNGTCNTETALSEVIIQVDPSPEAYAGEPGFICETQGFHLANATVANNSSFIWAIFDGQGEFDDPTMLTPVFYPDPVDEVTEMTLMLTAYGQDECINSTDISYVTVQVDPDPYAYAGTNGETCLSIPYLLFDSDALNYSMLLWEVVSGEGYVDFPNTLHPSYVPNELDTDSYVTLRLTAFGDGECSDLEDYSLVNIFIQGLPEAYAGPNLVTCFSESIQITQAVSSTESIFWEINSGNGVLDNPTIINPTYTPLVGDEGTIVELILNVTGDGACGSVIVQSQMAIQIDALPTAFAGATGTTCATDAYELVDATADNNEYVIWSVISGNGYIEEPFILNTQYNSSASDAGNIVRLRLAAYGEGACGSSYAESFIDIDVIASPIAYFTSTSPACENEAINFTDQSTTQEGTIDQWEWDFGDGQTSSEQNPENVYVSDGYFSVILTVTNTNGCTASYTSEVTVSPLPVASFNYSGDLCSLSPIFFNDLSQTDGGVITSWSWDFGDPDSGPNNTSTLQDPYHIFIGEMPTNGYPVSLTVTNSQGCSDMIQLEVIVFEPVEIDFTAADEPFCIADTIQFNSVGDVMAHYHWDFGDGVTSNFPNPTHSYLNAGTYTVSLLVEDTDGCEGYVEHDFIVNENPAAAFSTSSPVCLGSAIEFLNYSTSPTGYITEWVWHFDDGTDDIIVLWPDNPNVSHTYELANTYHPTLTVTNSNGCSSSIYHEVIITNGPVAAFDYSGTCAESPVSFIDLSQENGGGVITSWSWDFGDPGSGVNNTSNFQNPSHIYSTPGSYFVDLFIENANGCTDTILDQEIIVTDSLVVEIQVDNDSICLDVQINFEAIATDAVTWHWDFGDGSTSDIWNPTHIYTETGTFMVTLYAETIDGCNGTAEYYIVVNESPVSIFSTDSPSCIGSPTNFYNESTSPTGYITEWVWSFGDGTADTIVLWPDNPDVSHVYSLEGTYNAMLTVTNSNGCSSSYDNEVVVTHGPVAAFDYSGTCAESPVSFIDLSQENGGGEIVSWSWDFGDPASGTSNASSLQDPTHSFTAPGTYTVQLIIENVAGCSDTAIIQDIVITDALAVDIQADNDTTCMDILVNFEAIAADAVIWLWDFGDGNTATTQITTHTYTEAGNFVVTLYAEAADGCSNTAEFPLVVRPNPVSLYTSTSPVCSVDSVYFTNLSTTLNGFITTWIWDMGDGSTPIQIDNPDDPNIAYKYNNSETYEVILTVIDNSGCENTYSSLIQVTASPIANFTWDNSCFDTPVVFTDLSSTNGGSDLYSWQWYFGDPLSGINNSSTLPNPTHIFVGEMPADGYVVTLIVTNTLGCDSTITHNVIVDEVPDVSFTMSLDTLCLNIPVQFTGESTSEISDWFWTFGDGGTSIDQNTLYVYSAPGTYTVTLTVTGLNGCTSTAIDYITIKDAPIANFSYANACLGDITYFTDESYSALGYITEWTWNFGDGSPEVTTYPDDPNVNHTYTSSNDYLVTLTTIDNYGCTDIIMQWVQVRTTPIAGMTYAQSCEPAGLVNFFDESEPGADGSPIQSWVWDFDDGNYSNEIDPEYIFAETDSCYQILLTVTDANGCYNTDTVELCLHGTLEVDFTSTEECLGTPTFFQTSYSPQSDSVASYTWNFNDGTPNQDTYRDTISHTFPNPGLFIVELTALDTNGCSTTAYHEVIIDSLPTARFSNTIGSCDTPTQFVDESLDGGEFIDSWYWDFGDVSSPNNTSTEQHPSHLYGPYDSTYQVKLIVTNFNGCIDSILQDVYVEPCLIADFELSTLLNCARYEQCFTDLSQISSNNGVITQWSWDFGDGDTYNYSIQQNHICHTYDQGDDYNVQLIVEATLNGATYQDTSIKIITVHPTPVAGIILAGNCLGDSTSFYDDTNPNGEPLTMWHWNFGDDINPNDTSILQNPTYLYPGYGTYTTELKVMNQYGCRDSITEPVEIYKLPEAAFGFEETCMSYDTYFMDESTADSSDIEHYIWNFGDTLTISDTSSLQNPSYIYDSTGYYTVELIITDGNQCSDTISENIEIYPIPTADFIIMDTLQQGQIYLDNISIESTSYYWDFDYDYGISSIEENPMHQYEEDGTYNIMLISYNDYGCPDTTYKLYDLLFTNLFVPNAFAPSNVNAELREFKPIGINLQSYNVEVYSAWGNLVFQSTLLEDGAPGEGWDGTFEGKELPTGSFIWHISAVFENGEHWKGSDNGDGNTSTSGTVTLIR